MGRTYKQFSLEERCELAGLLKDGRSIRQIAAILGAGVTDNRLIENNK